MQNMRRAASCVLCVLRAAAVFLSAHTPTPNPPQTGASARSPALVLPEAVLRLVVSRGLAGGLELYGVYGASLAARDLASLARVCRGFGAIARDGFEELAEEVARQEDAKTTELPPPPFQPGALARLPAGLGWPFWEALWAADPAAAEEADVKKAAAALKMEVRLFRCRVS